MQFQAVKRLYGAAPIDVLPLALEDLPSNTGNIGIVCGFEVDSLDIDDDAGLAWAVANQPMTPWRVKTGSGGEHWYFKRRPGDLRTGMVLSLPEGKSLHFRGEDSLVVAPHSTHWTGKNYQPVGDWGVPFSALPYFNREAAEKIRGLNIRGVKEVGRSTQAAAMREGRLPLTGSWSQDEIETLLDGAYERLKPEFRSAVFRKHKYIRFLEKQAPCRAGAATGEAMNVLRVGLVNLLLPAPLVLDLAAASEWATKATEADGVTPWAWRRDQLADLVDRVLRTTWADRFGYWVSDPAPKSAAPAPAAPEAAAPAALAEGGVTP